MRRLWVLVARSLLIGSVAACSSSSVSVPGGEAVAPDASPDATLGASDDAAAGEDASSIVLDAAQPVVDAEPDAESDGGASHAEVDASMACVSFCKCMAMNCADKVFPEGCLYDCATQTDWDLPCRANMCSLVQAQPNNDHCTHAFGVNECLDQ